MNVIYNMEVENQLLVSFGQRRHLNPTDGLQQTFYSVCHDFNS